MDSEEEAVERAKKLWKDRQKLVERDRKDFAISKSIAGGDGISEDELKAWGKDRAVVNMPILDPAVNAIADRFDNNPFTFKIPEQMEDIVDTDELTAALSESLREICWDGVSYILVYAENGKIKFRVLDNMNVVFGKCRLKTGEDCKEALYIDKISKKEAEKNYPGFRNFTRTSITSYSGPNIEGDEYEEVTFWEQTDSGVNIYKFIGGELAENMSVPLPCLPVIRIIGKKVKTEKRSNWRGLPYIVRSLLTTLTYMSSLLQERIATAPSFNFWLPEESASDAEKAKQMARMNGTPRAVAYYRALEDGQVLPVPLKVDKSAGIEELMAHSDALEKRISSIAGAVIAPPATGQETAESVLLRKEGKENATDLFLRNLLTGAQVIAKAIESTLAFLASEKAKELGFDAMQYIQSLGLQDIKIEVTESIFAKAKQAADSQKVIAFASFLSQNPQSADFADAMLETLDLSDDSKERMRQALEARKQREQQGIEQLQQQAQMQAQELQQAQAAAQELQQQLAMMQKQLEAVQNANMVMQADSEAKVLIKEMEFKNQLAIKQMEIDFKYAELAAKTGNDSEKNSIAAAKVANEQQNKVEAATGAALEHPTKGAFT